MKNKRFLFPALVAAALAASRAALAVVVPEDVLDEETKAAVAKPAATEGERVLIDKLKMDEQRLSDVLRDLQADKEALKRERSGSEQAEANGVKAPQPADTASSR